MNKTRPINHDLPEMRMVSFFDSQDGSSKAILAFRTHFRDTKGVDGKPQGNYMLLFSRCFVFVFAPGGGGGAGATLETDTLIDSWKWPGTENTVMLHNHVVIHVESEAMRFLVLPTPLLFK